MNPLYIGNPLPAGFLPAVKSPFDVRIVVRDTVERNALDATYPGMVVTTIGVANALGEFSGMKVWRLKKDILASFFAVDADWVDITGVDNSVYGGNYKGTFNIDQSGAYTPNLNSATIRAALKAGDYYIVAVAGGITAQLVPTLDGITSVQSNDTLWYNGTTFAKYENTNPTVLIPLYTNQQGPIFNTDVKQLIRDNAIKQYIPQPYLGGELVYNSYTINLATYTDTWYALNSMSLAGSSLPATGSGNNSWLLLGSTNGDKLVGIPIGNDKIGLAATLGNIPVSTTKRVYLSPEEIDARIKQYGGGGGGTLGAIQGGNAATFHSELISEIPANTP